MKKILVFAGTGIALCSTLAFADPDPAKPPLANAIETVTEQSLEHPNKGLSNAVQRLQENAIKQQEKRTNHPPGQNKAETNDRGAERAQVAERVDRPERADRPDRPDRPDKPDRPDRGARAIDRPLPPGQARK